MVELGSGDPGRLRAGFRREPLLRRLFGGTGGTAVAGGLVMAVGMLFLGAILASPGAWQWFAARPVAGQEVQGVVTYHVGGVAYSLDDVNSFRSGPRTVYVDPSDPGRAAVSVTVARASDWALTAGPVLIGAFLIGLSFARRRRLRRVMDAGILAAGDRAFGFGIDPGTVERLRGRHHPPGGRDRP